MWNFTQSYSYCWAPHTRTAYRITAMLTMTSFPAPNASLDSSLNARLQALEATLGISSSEGEKSAEGIERRLNALEQKVKASTPASLHATWDESDRLLRDLHPGSNLTYQQPSKNYPILFRRKEVLASADSLKQDMDKLSSILNLLLIAQKQTDTPLREEQVTQAPILTSLIVSEEDQRRMDSVLLQVRDIQSQIQNMATHIDSLVEAYHAAMSAVSNSIVAAHEAIDKEK